MARDYDSQLLESVAVRRRRMRDALLFGVRRGLRTADERPAWNCENVVSDSLRPPVR